MSLWGLVSSFGAWVSSHCSGFSCYGAQALGQAGFGSCDKSAEELQFPDSKAQDQSLWCTGLVASWHMGSSQMRDQT